MSDRYCVFGNPIEHSKSPMIHAEFARQTEQAMEYVAQLAPTDGFARAGRPSWRRGRGANVTVPFKGDAFALCDTLSHRAKRAQAVNTLIVGGNGRTYGDTTDGVGLVRDLAYQGVTLKGKRLLVLGAGGAVRGVLESLLAEEPACLQVANRTAEKATQLAAAFADLGPITGSGYAAIEGPFDLVINGTSASLSGALPPLPDALFSEGALGLRHDVRGRAYDLSALGRGAGCQAAGRPGDAGRAGRRVVLPVAQRAPRDVSGAHSASTLIDGRLAGFGVEPHHTHHQPHHGEQHAAVHQQGRALQPGDERLGRLAAGAFQVVPVAPFEMAGAHVAQLPEIDAQQHQNRQYQQQ